jgi:hypothetical protein
LPYNPGSITVQNGFSADRKGCVHMKKRVLVISGILAAAAVLYFMYRPGAGPSGASLLPKDTIVYSGCRNALKLGAGLTFADFSEDLRELGLSDEESRRLDTWIKDLRRIHFGLAGISIVPLSVDAVLILEGSFTPLIDALPEEAATRFKPSTPYRDVGIRTLFIPTRSIPIEVMVTEPVENRILIALNRKTMTQTIDRLLDGGPSLADDAEFQEMTALPEIRKKDVVSYLNTQEYLTMLLSFVKTLPLPAAQQAAQMIREELRLDAWGPSVSGQSLTDHNRAVSFIKLSPDLPIYQQFEFSVPAEPKGVPADITQVMVLQVKDAARARQQLTDLIERIVLRAAPLAGVQLPPRPVQFAEQLLGFRLSEIDPLLSGEFMMWQHTDMYDPQEQDQTFVIGITDADAVRQFILSRVLSRIGLRPVETAGVSTLPGADTLAWSIQPDRLLISTSPEKLADALNPDTARLTDNDRYLQMRKRLPDNASYLHYVDYSHADLSGSMPPNVPPQLAPLFTCLQSLSMLQTSVAADGMMRSDSFTSLDISSEQIRELIRAILHLVKDPEAFSPLQ